MISKNHRLLELDALRGLAALAVVAFHYFYRYDAIYGHEDVNVEWSRYGEYGVELFFMVSGFVIFWTLKRIEKPYDFIVSRFSRLYPAYWCALVITFSMVSIFGLRGREVSAIDALMNTLMFQEYLQIPDVDGVYWTLTVELTFYFWMFLFYQGSVLDKVEGLFSAIIGLSVMNSLGVLQVPDMLYKGLIMEYLPFFTAGICFYKIVNSVGNCKLAVGCLFFSMFSTIAIYSVNLFLLFSAFFLVFYLALTGRTKFLSSRILVFLGSISYPLYLLHQNIGYIIINEFYRLSWNPVLGIGIATTVSIALATLVSRFVEIPSLKYIRYQYSKGRSTPTPIAIDQQTTAH